MSYSSDTLANGDLLAYWRLGDSGATAVDSEGGFDLTIGSGWTKSVPALINDSDDAMTGDGTAQIGDAASGLNPWSSAFTIEFWAREEVDLTSYHCVVSQESYGVNGFRLGRHDATNGWSFWTDEDAGDIIMDGEYFPSALNSCVVDETAHIVLTRSGGTFTLYKDGSQLIQVTTGTYVAPAGGLRVGGAGGANWTGTVDEIAVYSSAKDASWVAARYALGVAAATQLLVPDADITTTGWLATPLWSKIDDAASPDGLIISTAASYAADTLANGDLISYWRLNDTGATAVDTESGYDVTINSGWTKGQTGLIAGDSDTAMVGDASNSIGVIPSGLNPWGSAFTIEGWGKPTGSFTGNNASILSQEVYTVSGFRFGRQEARWAFWTSESGGTINMLAGVASVVAGNTYHVVLTRSGGTFTLYVNGTQANQVTTGTYVTAGAGGNLAGHGGGYWGGTIDEVAVYSSAKDASWVAARYALGS